MFFFFVYYFLRHKSVRQRKIGVFFWPIRWNIEDVLHLEYVVLLLVGGGLEKREIAYFFPYRTRTDIIACQEILSCACICQVT